MSLPDDYKITARDAKNAGLCVSGIRKWCEDNSIDVKRLITEGIPVSEVRALNDGYGNLVIQRTEQTYGRRGR